MAWPAESGSLGLICAARPKWKGRKKKRIKSRVFGFAALRGHWYLDARGYFRVFNSALYRFYRSSTGVPAESDSPFETNASLPYTTTATFANGTWRTSVDYFNGVVSSGFRPLGENGETYLRQDVSGGVGAASPPQGPNGWRIEKQASGVIRVIAYYFETGDLAADTWAIAYTTDGSTPPADTPDVTEAMPAAGVAILSYDLPAQADGTTVKVRLQTYSSDNTAYSESSTVETETADAAGPTTPLDIESWRGRLPEDV